jgi:hypothetical protein
LDFFSAPAALARGGSYSAMWRDGYAVGNGAMNEGRGKNEADEV